VLSVRIGKQDITGGFECHGCPVAFDLNTFADDETTQFLTGGIVGNPTIPFPSNGLGIVAFYNPVEWWYAAAGVADAQAQGGESSFNTTFNGKLDLFYVAETGVAPVLFGNLPGTYRFGVWYDPQTKADLDGTGTKDDDAGVYVSFDQMLWKESADKDDTQGLGGFFRFGWADPNVSTIKSYAGGGLQWQGLLPTRDNDVLAIGAGHAEVSSQAGLTETGETAIESYYKVQIAPWIEITPSLQYIVHPGALSEVDDALVFAIRLQIAL